MSDAPVGARVVAASGLEKSFGSVHVLNGLDLEVPPGEIVGLLGPNGAGKTTLLRILATLARADAGTARVNGHDVGGRPEEVRRTTGVVMHSSMLYQDLTARENLLFHVGMYRMIGGERRALDVAARLGVSDRLDDRIRTLSHGLQKRFAIARALLHEPSLLLLDEPDAGLDQASLSFLRAVLDDHRASGGSALMVTHGLERAIEICDRVLVLAGGRVVYDVRRDALDIAGLQAAYAELTGAA